MRMFEMCWSCDFFCPIKWDSQKIIEFYNSCWIPLFFLHLLFCFMQVLKTVCYTMLVARCEGMIKSSSVESCHMWEVERVGVDLISMLGQLAVIKTRNDDLHKVWEEKERFVLQRSSGWINYLLKTTGHYHADIDNIYILSVFYKQNKPAMIISHL